MRQSTLLPIAAAALLAAAPLAGQAADKVQGQEMTRAYGASDQVRTANGIRYACTGVGKDSRDNARWNEFPAKLVFATPDGAYLAGITTRITRADGNEVIFSEWCDGPWLLVDLEPGTYEVTTISEDKAGEAHKKTVRMQVGQDGQSRQVVEFPRNPS